MFVKENPDRKKKKKKNYISIFLFRFIFISRIRIFEANFVKFCPKKRALVKMMDLFSKTYEINVSNRSEGFVFICKQRKWRKSETWFRCLDSRGHVENGKFSAIFVTSAT